jgi:hypothetical protein
MLFSAAQTIKGTLDGFILFILPVHMFMNECFGVSRVGKCMQILDIIAEFIS